MTAFARTKIQPPRLRAGALMARPVLEERVAQAVREHRAVLLCAAAGYGKTSVLARQVERLPAGTAVAWVSCDTDDSPVQLLECLVAALEPYDPPWRTDPESLIAGAALATRREQRREIAVEVINALDACEVEHGVIFVDDLHRVEHPQVYEFLELLLERFTSRWTMVIATRHEPPLALARLRAAGALAEFRFTDLRFDAEETQALAERAGVNAEAAQALFARTEGWPVGLRLALDMLRSNPAAAASLGAGKHLIDRRVFDFLAAEVLDRLRPELREFLLACSVLPELTPVGCAAVTGDARAAARLEEIDRAGLFVTPLAEAEPTWRLHDLFRAALEQRLRLERPHAVPQLLARAAASESDPARRIGYLLHAQSWAAAAAELRAQAPGLLTAGQVSTVAHLLERFPAAQQECLADLQLTQAVSGWARWDWPAMQAAAGRAAQLFEQAGRPLDALEARGYEVIGLRAGGQRERCALVSQALETALDVAHAGVGGTAPAGVLAAPGTGNEPEFVARALLALNHTWDAFDEGRLAELPALLQAQMNLLDRSTGADSLYRSLPLPLYVGMAGMRGPMLHYVQVVLARTDRIPGELRTLARGLLGAVRLWAGDLAGALPELREAAEEVRWRDHPLRSTLYVQTPLNLALALAGEREALLAEAERFEALLRRVADVPAFGQRVAFELFTLARALLCAGCDEHARGLLRSLHGFFDAHERPVFTRQRQALAGYLAWLGGDGDEALDGFEPLLDDPALDLFGLASELRLRVAWLRLAKGCGAERAAAALAPLFARHAGDADVAAVWLAGPVLLEALAATDWGPALAPERQRRLAGWAQQARALQAAAPAPAAAAATAAETAEDGVAFGSYCQPAKGGAAGSAALSARELEVLQRLAAGDSNKLIARAFDLSPHTVKRHVANILDKLGLTSRGQAAAWYHEQA